MNFDIIQGKDLEVHKMYLLVDNQQPCVTSIKVLDKYDDDLCGIRVFAQRLNGVSSPFFMQGDFLTERVFFEYNPAQLFDMEDIFHLGLATNNKLFVESPQVMLVTLNRFSLEYLEHLSNNIYERGA